MVMESGGRRAWKDSTLNLEARQEIDKLSQTIEQQKSEIRMLREMLGEAYEKLVMHGIK